MVKAQVETDADYGGRWTSLQLRGREWLWRRTDPARASVRPGDAFVDVGGLEECVPTVRGAPDHGAAWSRAWQRAGDTESVDCGDFFLARTVRCTDDEVQAYYRLMAQPGYRFVWAAHALLDVSPAASVEIPDGTPVRLYPEAALLLPDGWPGDALFVEGQWPTPCGLPLHRLGPDDGTAIGAVAVGCRTVGVLDGDRLVMRLTAAEDVPASVALWRNLGGFPPDRPYRSIGVEPMLGAVFDRAHAGANDAVTVPASGSVEWQLTITAEAA
ncbi:MAG TPA: hypothetical protein VE442_18435 [Jatrophihabitans sp.]|jgi:hypothetical protein|nr:hypothetical protein [Jatrophihabitans sp.]